MQDIRCVPRKGANNVSSACVSAVFRAVPPWKSQYMAAQRTELNWMTLSGFQLREFGFLRLASSAWFGCLGLADLGCHSRICLYIPTSFSIKRRNIIFGKISSIKNTTNESQYPLQFEIHPLQLWNRYGGSLPLGTYKYSKVKLAGVFFREE